MTAAYPEAHAEFDNAKADEDMAFLIEIIKAVRTIRMEVNAPMSSAIDILIQLDDEKNEAILRDNMEYVENFLHPKKLEISGKIKAPKLAKTAVIAGARSSFHCQNWLTWTKKSPRWARKKPAWKLKLTGQARSWPTRALLATRQLP